MICDDCGRTVKLERQENRTLIVTCGCETRSIKVVMALPEGWL